MKYIVEFYIDYVIEANNKSEAKEKALKKFVEEIENRNVGLTEIFDVYCEYDFFSNKEERSL